MFRAALLLACLASATAFAPSALLPRAGARGNCFEYSVQEMGICGLKVSPLKSQSVKLGNGANEINLVVSAF
jgi:hypothetical protein